MPDVTGHDLDSDVLACIELCIDCNKACLQTAMHCLQMGEEHAEANHVRLMFDCAEICQTSANFMLRGSDLHGQICGACAAVCARCADDCERFDDDPRMLACAEECRRCAESCQRMATHRSRTQQAGARRSDRGLSSRNKEAKLWKPTATTPARAGGSTVRRSPSSSRRGSSRSS